MSASNLDHSTISNNGKTTLATERDIMSQTQGTLDFSVGN